MNEYLLSVLLGVIEGLTEFLPVSSTAHLRIAEALVNIDLASGYWKMYTIVIQLGASASRYTSTLGSERSWRRSPEASRVTAPP
jgi:undecaprenyl pyrophosphate phosphatase UppP